VITLNRVQLSRAKGSRKPPGAMTVDRSTMWGNPFEVGRDGDKAQCVARFERLLAGHCDNEAERAWLARAWLHRDKLAG
jgi:hypothetical protein